MKKFFKILILFSIVFFIGSCSDPIFFTVFNETPKLKPYIDGSPTNFAEYDGKLFVASGKKIFEYNGTWSEWGKLGDRIRDLAATTGSNASLYARYLENDSGNGKIRNLKTNTTLNLSNVQSIHANGDVLFVSVRTSPSKADTASYEISYKKETDAGFTKISLEKTDSLLVGVASNSSNYYLCAKTGIYRVPRTIGTVVYTPVLTPGGDDVFTGIINLGNTNHIAAISSKGKLYEIDNTDTIRTVRDSDFGSNRNSTGALAVWYRNNTDANPALLLVGRRETYMSNSSGYTNGYVEFTLEASGKISSGSFNEPGPPSSPSSIDNNERYVSSLGKEIVNHMIQTPKAIDTSMRLLASTQQNGVWSYRDRGEGERWNSEQR
jgi:hypothetical protein